MERLKEQLELAEMRDGFLRMVKASPINQAARRSCPYQPWNDQSQAVGANELLRHWGKDDIQVIIMSPSTEAGMPHTRAGNIICLPVYWPAEKLEETLRHELVHIDQRRQAIRWHSRLSAAGWVPISESKVPDEWIRRCRLNPDTCQERWWAWQGRWVPLPVFEREDAPVLREIDIFWLDLSTGEAIRRPPPSYTSIYGKRSKSEQEHPFELYAYST
jgi:hypothetical protein